MRWDYLAAGRSGPARPALRAMGSLRQRFALGATLALLGLIPATVSGATDALYLGALSGAAEVPRVSTNAAGTAYLHVNAAGTQLRYAVSYSGLSSPLMAAELEVGTGTVRGKAVFPLRTGRSTMFGSLAAADLRPSSAARTWAAALAAMRDGRLYVNLRTTAHPNGEIRARLTASVGTAAAAAATTPPPSAKPGQSTTLTSPPASPAPAPASPPGAAGPSGTGAAASASPTAPAASAAPSASPTTNGGQPAAGVSTTAPPSTGYPGIDPIPIAVVVLLGLLGLLLAIWSVAPGRPPRRAYAVIRSAAPPRPPPPQSQ